MVSAQVFDPEAFLTTVGAGRTIATYKPKSYIFRQGTKCDAVFYIQKGHVELSVVSEQGKERVVGMLGPGLLSSAKDAWPAIRVYLARHAPPRKPPWPAWRARQ